MAGDDEKDTEWRARQAAPGTPPAGAAPTGTTPGAAQQPAYQPPPARPVDGLSIAALVLGVVAVVLCWIPFLGAIIAILAIIFGAIGVGRKISTGMGVAGLVLGLLAFLANVALTIVALTS